jgi:hypothetical protein
MILPNVVYGRGKGRHGPGISSGPIMSNISCSSVLLRGAVASGRLSGYIVNTWVYVWSCYSGACLIVFTFSRFCVTNVPKKEGNPAVEERNHCCFNESAFRKNVIVLLNK